MDERRLLHHCARVVHDHLLAEGFLRVRMTLEGDPASHLVMCYRNQLPAIFVECYRNGQPVIVLTPRARQRLLAFAADAGAIPCTAALDLCGGDLRAVNTATEIAPRNGFETVLRTTELLTEVTRGRPWRIADCDLDAAIEMTDWELHDFGVQVVRTKFEREGHTILYYNTDLDRDPQVWVARHGRRTACLVRTVRFPTPDAAFPYEEGRRVLDLAARHEADALFCSVSVASMDDAFDKIHITPLYRGRGMVVRYQGPQDIHALIGTRA